MHLQGVPGKIKEIFEITKENLQVLPLESDLVVKELKLREHVVFNT